MGLNWEKNDGSRAEQRDVEMFSFKEACKRNSNLENEVKNRDDKDVTGRGRE